MDGSNTILKYDLRLDQHCLNVLACFFWDFPYIKEDISGYFRRGYRLEYEWSRITEEVIRLSKKFDIYPQLTRTKVEKLIPLIGQKIHNWNLYLIDHCNLHPSCASKIYWTSVGTIDENKIFELFWENNKDLFPVKDDHDCKESSLFTLACIFNQQKFIKRHFEKMKKAVKRSVPYIDANKLTIFSLMSIWLICFTKKRKLLKFYKDLDTVNLQNESHMENILKVCISGYYHKSFEYFVNSFKEGMVKQNIMLNIAQDLLDRVPDETYLREKRAEVVLVLINNINGYDFLQENLRRISKIFFGKWPYEGLLLELFRFIDKNNIFRTCSENLLQIILEFLKSDKNLDLARKRTYCNMLKVVLKITRKFVKKRLMLQKSIEKIYEREDYFVLAIYLNDSFLGKEYREHIIYISGIKHFKSLVENGEFIKIDSFIEIVKLTNDERKRFKNQFHVLQTFLNEDKIELAEKLLEWLSEGSNEEKLKLKKELNIVEACGCLYKIKKFDLEKADHLFWQFVPNEEEIEDIKITLLHEELFLDELCNIWGIVCNFSIEEAKNKCNNLLKWFCKPDEVDFRKKEISSNLLSKDFIRIFCNNLLLSKNLETVEELFKLFFIPQEKVADLKLEMINNINDWLKSDGINNFRVTYALVNWIFADENMKKDFIGKFLNSPNSSKFIFRVIEQCKTDKENPKFCEPALLLLNFWIKPFGDTQEIKSNMKNHVPIFFWSETGLKTFQVNRLLDILETQGFILMRDLQMCFEYEFDDDKEKNSCDSDSSSSPDSENSENDLAESEPETFAKLSVPSSSSSPCSSTTPDPDWDL